MKLIQLRYFCGVVEHGGFISASKELNVAQPALSRQISDLERELDCQLLERGPGGTNVTLSGQRFYAHAKKILEQVSLAKADARNSSASLTGQITIALPVGMASHLAARIVKSVNDEHSAISVKIEDGLGFETGQLIDAGKVDFGLLPNVGNLQNVTLEPVFEEHLFLFSKRTGEPDTSDIDLIDLQDLPLISPDRKVNVRRELENGMMRIGGRLNIIYEQQSLLTIRGMVQAGIGSAVLNWPSMSDLWFSGELNARRIINPGLSRTVCLAVPDTRPLSAAAAAAYAIVRRIMFAEVEDGNWRGGILLETSGKHPDAAGDRNSTSQE